MPAAFGGEVGGARSTTDLPMPAPGMPPSAPATTGVAAVRIGFQVCPLFVDWKTPRPVIPAYRIRAPAGDVVSSASDRTSPALPTPCVQFWPPSVDRNMPKFDAR